MSCQIQEILSHYLVQYFFQPTLFFLSFLDADDVTVRSFIKVPQFPELLFICFSVSNFSVVQICLFVFCKFTGFPLSSPFHHRANPLHLKFLVVIFFSSEISIDLLCMFYFFAEFFFFFTKCVSNVFVIFCNIFSLMAAIKFLSDNLNICIISVLVPVDCLSHSRENIPGSWYDK